MHLVCLMYFFLKASLSKPSRQLHSKLQLILKGYIDNAKYFDIYQPRHDCDYSLCIYFSVHIQATHKRIKNLHGLFEYIIIYLKHTTTAYFDVINNSFRSFIIIKHLNVFSVYQMTLCCRILRRNILAP